MVKEAEENAEADKKRKEEADLRNEADQLIFQAEKTVKDLGDKVTEEEAKANRRCICRIKSSTRSRKL